jgi:hypothetical protein
MHNAIKQNKTSKTNQRKKAVKQHDSKQRKERNTYTQEREDTINHLGLDTLL